MGLAAKNVSGKKRRQGIRRLLFQVIWLRLKAYFGTTAAAMICFLVVHT